MAEYVDESSLRGFTGRTQLAGEVLNFGFGVSAFFR